MPESVRSASTWLLYFQIAVSSSALGVQAFTMLTIAIESECAATVIACAKCSSLMSGIGARVCIVCCVTGGTATSIRC